MNFPGRHRILALFFGSIFALLILWPGHCPARAAEPSRRFLYVAAPGVRDYLEYGGHGVLVFDIDHDHKFVKRIAARGVDEKGKPLNVKGICASAAQHRFYVSTLRFLTCFDLETDQILWEKAYDGGCDRMAISPDGKIIYLPSLEGPHWHVIDALSGEIIKKLVPNSGAHNTLYSQDGGHAYLAGLKSPILRVTDTRIHDVSLEVGPFSNVVRPFTINRAATLCFVNVNERLGFEAGDLKTGKVLCAVTVGNFQKGPVKRHGCPSHGIGLTPDENELWVCDATNQRLHIFDVRGFSAADPKPPREFATLVVRDEPGWVTFSIDGKYAYPSTGEVIDVKTRGVVATLKDEKMTEVQSEKMVEIDFAGGKPVRAGDQFGVGRRN
ncbi:MAG TPA: YncE family protein [Verrucomicrobiae bacterium]|nr:YncE family protein [Verrucomicrobiae bacterium]